jgi:hypothetical protein
METYSFFVVKSEIWYNKYIFIFSEKFMNEKIVQDNILKDQLLQVMIDNEGSDMYITVGSFPAIKI